MNEKEKALNEMVGAVKGDWVWCLHCERVFRWDGISDECPNEGCSGNPIDWHGWGFKDESQFPGPNKSKYPDLYPDEYYPVEPREGIKYPSNGKAIPS